jgi:thioesterase domain-containing protein/acyl carrier protein
VRRACPDLVTVNAYGPTETTTFATCHVVEGWPSAGRVPIGRPLDGVGVAVLDARLRPVPVGSVGELYLTGAGLARGYAGQAARTAERFVAAPAQSGAGAGARMYRTGDLARWNHDGRLEFLGRADTQVKIRGFRVEPDEVAAVLEGCHGVARAVVTTSSDTPHGRELIAYVQPATDGIGVDELRDYATRALPAAMRPARYHLVERIPLNRHGKVDRAALAAARPNPSSSPRENARTSVMPRTTNEAILCRVFAEVLGVPAATPDADFFELGGHSLLAMRLAAAAEAELRVPVSISAVLSARTPAALARRLGQRAGRARDDLDRSPVLALRRYQAPNDHGLGTRAPLFCLPPGMGFGWPYASLLPHLPRDRPLYALQAPALRAGEPLPVDVEDAAAGYLARVREIQPRGPYLLLGHSFGGLMAYQLAVTLRRAGERVGLVVVLDAVPAIASLVPELRERDAIEQESLGILAGAAGLSTEPPLDRAAVIAGARSSDSAFHGMPEAELARLLAVCDRHVEIAHEYVPPTLDAPVLFVSSQTEAGPVSNAAKLAAWRRVAGDLTSRHLACEHGDMLEPAYAAELAAACAPLLKEY